MKTDQLKMNINSFIINAINTNLPPNNTINKLLNSGAKIYYNQKRGIIYNLLDNLSNENQEIDEMMINNVLRENFFKNGKFELHLNELSNKLPNFLENKVLIFNEDEIKSIFNS